jgi:hypothetical protein
MYLKQTYNPDIYVPIAHNYYKLAITLTEQRSMYAAIDEYTKAIDLLPIFFKK